MMSMLWQGVLVLVFVLAPQEPGEPLDGLRPEHPRLLLTEERLAELHELARTDELLQKAVADVRLRADKYLAAKPLKHELRGPRLLHVSRACLDRVLALGLMWRWTGEEKYADGVRDNLLTVSAFPDWNPSHFLDTAEMSLAVGVGFDWCFAALTPEERATIRAALIAKGLQPGLKCYSGRAWWPRSEFNWNQVCNGGMLGGALAIAETDSDLAAKIVEHAVKSLPTALMTYEPDGAWGEGPGYWSYATHYTVYGLACLRTALGHDFKLSHRTGLARAGYFPLSACGPTGLYVAYADASERARRGGLPALLWLSQCYQDPAIAVAERAWIADHRAAPQHVMWYWQPRWAKGLQVPRDQRFRGEVELVILRSALDDPEALFVAIKGGYNAVNHGHLDLGNFEVDVLGRRWARDLGRDDYNLPGYWDGKEGGRRWTYYRLGSMSHNVLTIDGKHQAVAARAEFPRFKYGDDGGQAILEITDAFPDTVARHRRGVRTLVNSKALVVQDELELIRACEVRWAWTTDAAVQIPADQPDTAVLTLDGKTCRLRLQSPPGARFVVESCRREPPEKTNDGVRQVVVRVPAQPGVERITVLFHPSDAPEPPVVPLDRW